MFRLSLGVPRKIHLAQVGSFSRIDFFSFLWDRYGRENGLMGIHEGTVLSEQVADLQQTWVLDPAFPPLERDWVEDLEEEPVELYFSGEQFAQAAALSLRELTSLRISGPDHLEEQDWDAQWKSAFLSLSLGSPDGIFVPLQQFPLFIK